MILEYLFLLLSMRYHFAPFCEVSIGNKCNKILFVMYFPGYLSEWSYCWGWEKEGKKMGEMKKSKRGYWRTDNNLRKESTSNSFFTYSSFVKKKEKQSNNKTLTKADFHISYFYRILLLDFWNTFFFPLLIFKHSFIYL